MKQDFARKRPSGRFAYPRFRRLLLMSGTAESFVWANARWKRSCTKLADPCRTARFRSVRKVEGLIPRPSGLTLAVLRAISLVRLFLRESIPATCAARLFPAPRDPRREMFLLVARPAGRRGAPLRAIDSVRPRDLEGGLASLVCANAPVWGLRAILARFHVVTGYQSRNEMRWALNGNAMALHSICGCEV